MFNPLEEEYESYEELEKAFNIKSNNMGIVEFLDNIMNNWDDRYFIVSDSLLISYMDEQVNLLGHVEKKRLQEIFKKYSESEDESLRQAVAKCLSYIGDGDIATIEKLLYDKEEMVRIEALESIVKVAGAKLTDKVIEIFRTDESSLVRLIAIRQLATIKDKNLTNIFIEAMESRHNDIFTEACMYLAGRKNRYVYRFLRRKYNKAYSRFERVCLSYALYFHGEHDKLKKILTALRVRGKQNLILRYTAALLLDFASENLKNKTRKLIVEELKEVLKSEAEHVVSDRIKNAIQNINNDIKKAIVQGIKTKKQQA